MKMKNLAYNTIKNILTRKNYAVILNDMVKKDGISREGVQNLIIKKNTSLLSLNDFLLINEKMNQNCNEWMITFDLTGSVEGTQTLVLEISYNALFKYVDFESEELDSDICQKYYKAIIHDNFQMAIFLNINSLDKVKIVSTKLYVDSYACDVVSGVAYLYACKMAIDKNELEGTVKQKCICNIGIK